MERKTVYKLFFVWDMEKEEAWLNEMAMHGWILDKVGFMRYTFVKGEPDSYAIRFELHGNDPAYIAFMEETGAEYIGRVAGWMYFRKQASLGAFDIYSDIDSRIGMLGRLAKMLSMVGAANIIIGLMNSLNRTSIGWVNLLCGCMLMYGLGRIHGKIEALKRQRVLTE